MPLPLARTNLEAHLYIDLRPCACGEPSFPYRSAVVEFEGDLASRYTGRCPRCGAEREFLFRIPDQVLLPRPGQVTYGGEAPSQLLDPGEWLWVADRYALAVPAEVAALDGEQRQQARQLLASAAAAVGEVLKFVPAGRDAVPDAAFWSRRGREVYSAEPGRFSRERLEVVRDTYREMAAELDT